LGRKLQKKLWFRQAQKWRTGSDLPTAQETHLRPILGEEDEVQYGTSYKTGREFVDPGRTPASQAWRYLARRPAERWHEGA